MTILGVNAFHGDASAALFRDGELLMAVEEERYNRIKHWAGLPCLAIEKCLAGASADHLAISRDPRGSRRGARPTFTVRSRITRAGFRRRGS